MNMRAGPAPAYLIINADDFAYFDCVTEGIIRCIRSGTVTATGVFANSPFLEAHARRLLGECDVDVGVHLNLTDRAPLTPRMADALRGHGGVFPGKFRMTWSILTGRIPSQLARDEFRAQIERCLAAGLKPVFLNSHEHIHMLPSLFRITLGLAEEYGIRHVRLSTPDGTGSGLAAGELFRNCVMRALSVLNGRGNSGQFPTMLGMKMSGRLALGHLTRSLTALVPGRIYELMCHPGNCDAAEIDDPRLLEYHDWQLESDALCSARLPDILAENEVRLIGYRHLRHDSSGALSVLGEQEH